MICPNCGYRTKRVALIESCKQMRQSKGVSEHEMALRLCKISGLFWGARVVADVESGKNSLDPVQCFEWYCSALKEVK